MKGSDGLGFTLSGGADTVGGCFVRDIVGGPAKEDGRLQAGDQILAVRTRQTALSSMSLFKLLFLTQPPSTFNCFSFKVLIALTKFNVISLNFFKVDGQDISTMKHMDAVNVLRATKQFVKLRVLRRPTGVSYNAITC